MRKKSFMNDHSVKPYCQLVSLDHRSILGLPLLCSRYISLISRNSIQGDRMTSGYLDFDCKLAEFGVYDFEAFLRSEGKTSCG